MQRALSALRSEHRAWLCVAHEVEVGELPVDGEVSGEEHAVDRLEALVGEAGTRGVGGATEALKAAQRAEVVGAADLRAGDARAVHVRGCACIHGHGHGHGGVGMGMGMGMDMGGGRGAPPLRMGGGNEPLGERLGEVRACTWRGMNAYACAWSAVVVRRSR